MPPIEFNHVWKRYQTGSQHGSLRDAIPALLKRMTQGNGHDLREGEFWAVYDASFHVGRAETLGIIGPNGAGKSTVLKLLSRICKQTKGDIRVRGRLAALIEVGAGFHPDLTGRENIYMNGTIMGLRRKEIDRLFDSIVAFSELEKFLDMPIKRYSSGMAVRLGFAVAAHVNPELLLIDEVLAVGDLSFQQKCYQRLLDLKARGTTMIFISHNLEAVQRICDRAVLLIRGSVAADGAPADVIAEYRRKTLQKQRFVSVWRPTGPETKDTAKDIELIDAQLTNPQGQAIERLQTGEPAWVRLRYDARRPIQDPSVVVTIERMDGLICHEASTRHAGITWPAWEGQGDLLLEYPAVNLQANAYFVTAALYEGQNPVPMARLAEPLRFQIVSNQAARGALHLEHQWHAEPAAVA